MGQVIFLTYKFFSHLLCRRQLIVLLREWYMHPSGEIPANDWNFSAMVYEYAEKKKPTNTSVKNPPLHAWATLQVYKHTKLKTGKRDLDFLYLTYAA